MTPTLPTLIAGIPAANNTLYHALRFAVGDPAALIALPPAAAGGREKRLLIVRDIEMERARRHARVDEVRCPADFAPPGGLSGDRETATAQAIAECLRRFGARAVRSDRTLALSYVDALQQAGITVEYDPLLGVAERRSKDRQEIEALAEAQAATEAAMAMACRMVLTATAAGNGELSLDGSPLTSERIRTAIDIFLLERGFSNPGSIVAGGPIGSDCHDHGHGVLRTGEPVIIDIFPRSLSTRYHGDCTRTVVHGTIPEIVSRMHRAVIQAKRAGIAAIRPGVTGAAVHQAAIEVIRAHGFESGLPPEGAPATWCGMVHGTGHGIGLDVHEPPLLAEGGPPLVVGDALTVEPGLYSKAIGGVRVEDMVVVTDRGCENLNAMPEGLSPVTEDPQAPAV